MVYSVAVREVQIAYYTVEAQTPKEALQAVRSGYADLDYTEYSHTLDTGGEVYDGEELEYKD